MTHSIPSYTEVAIIGSGFSGLCMAVKLKEAGIQDFVMLEKASEIGGTWRENTYPGAACDVQSHLYSFSFYPNPNWPRVFSGWQDIQQYLLDVTEHFQLRPHIRFNTVLTAARFDEIEGVWQITLNHGQSIKARSLVLGTGPLHVPSLPHIQGLDLFKGDVWHSSQWRHDISLVNKNVASIGTGGSAIQYVPEVAKQAKQLNVFQRTPAWVVPRNERAYTQFEMKMFSRWPFMRRLYRTALYWKNESRVLPMMYPALAKVIGKIASLHLRHQIKHPELRRKLTPDYVIGCKRILISNQYYPAFNRQNVELVTDGIKCITHDGVVDENGVKRPADVIILGTGFEADPTEYLKKTPITGRSGITLMDAWKNGAEAYWGISVTGFPNFFQMVGPNTGLGHNSIIFMIESQTQYIVDAIKRLSNKPNQFLDVKPEKQRIFNQNIQRKLKSRVWSTGCTSWYTRKDGKNFTLWPGTTFSYRFQTQTLSEEAYEWVPCQRGEKPIEKSEAQRQAS